MSGDVADEGWRGKARTRRGEQQQQQQQQQSTLNSQPPAEPHIQPQPQLQLQQQLDQQFQQQLPSAKILKSSSPDLSSPNLSDCESVPTPAHFLSRSSSPNAAPQGTSASTSTASATVPAVTASKSSGGAGVKSEKQDSAAATGTAKPKRTRRKKEDKDPKEKTKETKPRRRRTSNSKNNNNNNNSNNNNINQAQNQQLSVTSDNADRGASRKRAKLDHPQDTKPSPPSRQSKITDLVTPHSAPAPAPTSTPSTLSPTHASNQFHLAPSSSTSPRLQPHHQPHHVHGVSQNSSYEAFPTNGDSGPPVRPYHIQPAPSSTPTLAPVSAPALGPPQQHAPPQRSSGQNYDPIRSAFDNSSLTTPQFSASSKISLSSSHHQFSPPPNTKTPPPRPVYRASASPAIASIIDPPIQPYSSAPLQSSLFHQQSKPSPENNHSAKDSPTSATPTSTPKTNTTTIQQPNPVHQPLPSSSLLQEPISMDIDSGNSAPAPASSAPSKPTAAASTKKGAAASTGTPSTAPSPKPSRTKDTVKPLLPSGSGLLAGTLFGVDPTDKSSSTTSTMSTPNIILHIPLNGKTNQIINFTRLAEQQYGFDALHPRLAAQRERLARVNAASAALERNEKSAKGAAGTVSAAEDDLSLDADRDSDGDGDVLMSGMGGSPSLLNADAGSDAGGAGAGGATATAAPTKKKRRRKIEEYDRDDPFVDDSELAWQEHAAASKDGFFVYSGPLIPEGEKVAVERADGSIKRGRGRGRGGAGGSAAGGGSSRGRGGGAVSSSAGQHHAGSSGHDGGGGGGAKGGGSTRGGGAVARKPRVTKAGRETMQREKMERQKLGLELVGKVGGAGAGSAGDGGAAGSGSGTGTAGAGASASGNVNANESGNVNANASAGVSSSTGGS
ncbi:hypothetical protein, variant [Blastomyces dermatitidis ATCC 26199]|nr:hypothetical protein BDFG_02041 [Blastomyces dermatitidis ATCC 26199]EQL36685.1 hypothetical protein, variant [Blastomyces dermatitidis ATCC 26199]